MLLSPPLSLSPVVQLVGVNQTVAESDGEVEVCLEMDRETEIPVSVNVTFTKNTDPAMTPAQGVYTHHTQTHFSPW